MVRPCDVCGSVACLIPCVSRGLNVGRVVQHHALVFCQARTMIEAKSRVGQLGWRHCVGRRAGRHAASATTTKAVSEKAAIWPLLTVLVGALSGADGDRGKEENH